MGLFTSFFAFLTLFQGVYLGAFAPLFNAVSSFFLILTAKSVNARGFPAGENSFELVYDTAAEVCESVEILCEPKSKGFMLLKIDFLKIGDQMRFEWRIGRNYLLILTAFKRIFEYFLLQMPAIKSLLYFPSLFNLPCASFLHDN